MNGTNGWSVRRRDTHHYLAGVAVGPIVTANWCRDQKNALPFIAYEEAREWVKYFGNNKPCYVEERRG